MASVIWMGTFVLLMAELVITGILVLPLPRVVRRFIAKKIAQLDLGTRFRTLSMFLILGLCVAVADAVSTLRHLELKTEDESKQAFNDPRAGYIAVSFDKQRKFRAERNMYLAGFALTLCFVIARIIELMQAAVQAEEECEVAKKRLAERSVAAGAADADGEESTISEDSAQPGAPGSTPFTLRRRNVTGANGNGDKDD